MALLCRLINLFPEMQYWSLKKDSPFVVFQVTAFASQQKRSGSLIVYFKDSDLQEDRFGGHMVQKTIIESTTETAEELSGVMCYPKMEGQNNIRFCPPRLVRRGGELPCLQS